MGLNAIIITEWQIKLPGKQMLHILMVSDLRNQRKTDDFGPSVFRFVCIYVGSRGAGAVRPLAVKVRVKELLQTMRKLGENMVWLLECIESGHNHGVVAPTYELRLSTHSI